jgi:hypothetical protein
MLQCASTRRVAPIGHRSLTSLRVAHALNLRSPNLARVESHVMELAECSTEHVAPKLHGLLPQIDRDIQALEDHTEDPQSPVDHLHVAQAGNAQLIDMQHQVR